jgi:PAS domain S-box-containing protein
MELTELKYRFSLVRSNFSNGRKALSIMTVGLLLTVAASFYVRNNEVEIGKKEYALVCNDIKAKITIRLHSYATLLRSGSAFYSICDTVNRQNWQKFIERIKISKNLSGIQGVGFSMIIPGDQLQKHIQQIRSEGFPQYTVKPAGERAVYTSIIYLEPFSGRNLRALGYDMFSEPVRRKAMEQSRDSDLEVLSGKVILVQETNKDVQFGTLMYVPVYRDRMPLNTVEQRRAAIKGWVYSPFRMNDLMLGILGRWDLDRLDRIHLKVYDDNRSPNSLLYNSQPNDSLFHDDSPSRTLSLPIVFNGKSWILLFTQPSQNTFFNSKVIIIFGGGIIISLLLMILSLFLFQTLNKARQIAGQSTLDLKQSEDRFKTLLDSTAEAIYGLDMNGKCTFSNQACLNMLRLTNADELLGINMHDLIHHSHDDGSCYDIESCRIYSAFLEGKGTHVDDEVLWRPDGSCFPAEYWSYPLTINGKIEGAVVTFIDITERRQSIEKINNARNEAEKANLAKSEFLSRMSHELRTPMNSILGFAQLLEMGGNLTEKQLKGVGYILSSGKHLLRLINEVLEISRIEAGQLNLSLEPVLISTVVSEVLDSLKLQAIAKEIKFDWINSPNNHVFVKADHQRIKQVLLNLLSNAVKYNTFGVSVIIRTEIMKTSEAGVVPVRISITDNGSGISQMDIPKLFIPFERIGAEKTQTEGTGLGLAVVKKLMEAMGGTVGVESVPGTGSTFWIELSKSKSQLETIQNSKILISQELFTVTKHGTILYIEDNASNIELVEQILSSERSNIRLVSNISGKLAVSLAIEFTPDLILLDLNLPDIHGNEVIALLQAEERTKSIPVVVISADAMPKQIEKLYMSGAKSYLTKPLDIAAFLREVDKWIVKQK